MKDPVSTVDGFTYDRESIEEWFNQGNRTSPMTGLPLSSLTLTPNYVLRSMIDEQATRRSSAEEEGDVMDEAEDQLVYLDYTYYANGTHLAVRLPDAYPTLPLSLVAVIDVSGSMSGSSTKPESNPEGGVLSRLDLVKHSVKTLIHTMRKEDMLAIVTFTNVAKLLVNFTCVDEDGKKTLIRALDGIKPESSTNLWDGLQMGINHASMQNAGRNTAVLLLTDGLPNAGPVSKERIAPLMKNLISKMDLTVHCCGFGYELDTPLMCSIAEAGGGGYMYIPDGTMVGTIFVHFIMNQLSVAIKNLPIHYNTEGETLETGPLRRSQTKNFWIPGVQLSRTGDLDLFVLENQATHPDASIVCFEEARCAMLAALKTAMRLSHTCRVDEGIQTMNSIVDHLKSIHVSNPDALASLLDDVVSSDMNGGQIMKGFENWGTWGQHYIPAIYSSHKDQVITSFKEKSLKHYSSRYMDEQVLKAEQIFIQLPPPAPSIEWSGASHGGQSSGACRSMRGGRSSGMNMRNLMNAAAGCFGPSTLVTMEAGSAMKVGHLRKGMKLKGGFRVKCIVEMFTGNNIEVCIKDDDLYLTPYHPVLYNEEWIFPKDHPDFKQAVLPMKTLYNLILEEGHFVESCGVKCVTLAHGFSGGAAPHPYFGTEKVIQDLGGQSGFDEGHVVLFDYNVTRDPETGLVNCMTYEPDT